MQLFNFILKFNTKVAVFLIWKTVKLTITKYLKNKTFQCTFQMFYWRIKRSNFQLSPSWIFMHFYLIFWWIYVFGTNVRSQIWINRDWVSSEIPNNFNGNDYFFIHFVKFLWEHNQLFSNFPKRNWQMPSSIARVNERYNDNIIWSPK